MPGHGLIVWMMRVIGRRKILQKNAVSAAIPARPDRSRRDRFDWLGGSPRTAHGPTFKAGCGSGSGVTSGLFRRFIKRMPTLSKS
jgi:hypothetical protein